MGFWTDFAAHRLGGTPNLWVLAVYGLCQLWVVSDSTVFIMSTFWTLLSTPQLVNVVPVQAVYIGRDCPFHLTKGIVGAEYSPHRLGY